MNYLNITKLNINLEKIEKNFGIVIGNFDGVHLGHKYHLNKFVSECRKLNIEPILITFSPHPKEYFNPEIQDFYLSSRKMKSREIVKLGINNIFTLEFDSNLQNLSAEKFFKNYIINHEKLRLIHLGHDFKLGEGKEDATDLIKSITKDKNIEIVQSSAYKIDEEILSSTYIRSVVKESVENVEKYLGRPYSLSGKVIRGKGLGKKSLFPTCNLDIEKRFIIPDLGVYITRVRFNGREYDSITNIGLNPSTDTDSNIKIETHIFFFKEDIYNEELELVFLKKIRNEEKFESLDALRSQISLDIEEAKLFHRMNSLYKLALIGKDISHSKSQEMYEKILKRFVYYDLIDCDKETEIPQLSFLRENFHGVSITAPYKRFFIDKLIVKNPKLDSINAIAFEKQDIVGVNTDYLAAKDILEELFQNNPFSEILVLGSGAMSKMLELIFNELKLSFTQISRKKNNFDLIPKVLDRASNKVLIINACSRDYTFQLESHRNFVFWDMNYNLVKHSEMFEQVGIDYIDGIGLLELQAKYALSFWKI